VANEVKQIRFGEMQYEFTRVTRAHRTRSAR